MRCRSLNDGWVMAKMAGLSRLSGFYKRSVGERLAAVADVAGLTDAEQAILGGAAGLTADLADHMIENVVGLYGLPLGIATNFLDQRARRAGADGRSRSRAWWPAPVSRPSWCARAAAFLTSSTTGRDDRPDAGARRAELVRGPLRPAGAASERLLALANRSDPVLVGLGGGARDAGGAPDRSRARPGRCWSCT